VRVAQTFACSRCSLRFPRGPACPECGDEAPIDLRNPDAKASLERKLGKRSLLGRWILPLAERGYDTVVFITLIVVLTLAAMLGAMLSGSMLAYFGAYLVVPVAGTVAWVLLWPKLLERLDEPKARRVLRVYRPPRLPEKVRTTLTGVVQGDATLVAPLSGRRCIAYRLVGRVGDDEVDDTVAATLDVALDNPDAELDLTGAIFELPTPAPDRTEVGPVLAPILAPLVVVSDDDIRGREAHLAEAVLAPGDRVEVEGRRDVRAVPDGYRGHKQTLRLAVHGPAPLRIRPIPRND